MVRRIFEMVAEGCALHAVKQGLDSLRIKSPAGKSWNVATIREILKDDVYRAHTHEEVSALVSPEVAARLEPAKLYGVYWFNTKRRTQTQVAETGPNGRSYRRRVKTVDKPREEWIAVPVPDAGISRGLVDAARAHVSKNARASSSGARFWELSGGLVSCGLCGRRMAPSTTVKGGTTYHYYRCDKRWQDGPGGCSHEKHHRADKLEQMVWKFVLDYLKNPEKLRIGLKRMLNEKRNDLCGDPEREARMWMDKLAETDRMRAGYQELAAKGLMTFEELGAKLKELEDIRQVTQGELETLEGKRYELRELERDATELLETYEDTVPERLENLTPEGRHHVYKALQLGCLLRPEEPPELTSLFVVNAPKVRESESGWRCPSARNSGIPWPQTQPNRPHLLPLPS